MTAINSLPVSHRFIVSFLIDELVSPIDIPFSQVSGLSNHLNIRSYREGGQNSQMIALPIASEPQTLILSGGSMFITPAVQIFEQVIQRFDLNPFNVLIMLLNSKNLPGFCWLLRNVVPVSWQTSALDASSNQVLVDNVSLNYESLLWVGLPAA